MLKRGQTSDVWEHVEKHHNQKNSNSAGAFSCCGFLRKKPPPFQQTLLLLRHSERRDRVDPNYRTSPEGQAWPNDAPLTEAGIALAKSVALEIAELHKEAHFSAVASSPYRRCLETAAEVARLLDLPVVLDQEIGEIWDKEMPPEPQPWRSNEQLVEMADELGISVQNPILDGGGYKLFGKRPAYPETLQSAQARYLVRIETYIEQSQDAKQNFVVVTHADALSAMLMMFERGNADVQAMDFCARIIAKRTMTANEATDSATGVFAKHWEVDFKGMNADILEAGGASEAKIYEKQHVEHCEEVQTQFIARKNQRTATDTLFLNTIAQVREHGHDVKAPRPSGFVEEEELTVDLSVIPNTISSS